MLSALFRDEGGVVALNFGRVFEHDAGEIAGGEGTVDVAAETLAAKVWQVAAVIDVRMAQHDRVNLLRVEGKPAIALDGFSAFTLKETALEQEALSVELEQEHRAGGRACGPKEVDSHPPEHENGRRKSRVWNPRSSPYQEETTNEPLMNTNQLRTLLMSERGSP